MTRDVFTPTAPALIAGPGPYTISHPYDAGQITATVQNTSGVQTELQTSDFAVSPSSSDTQGSLTLTTAAATLYDGQTLTIDRVTVPQQGWQGLTARETGLEAQLDQMTQADQEFRAELDGLGGSIQTQVAAAAQSATDAQAAADEIQDVAIGTVTTLPTGSAATMSYDPQTGEFSVGLPRGAQGIAGSSGLTVPLNSNFLNADFSDWTSTYPEGVTIASTNGSISKETALALFTNAISFSTGQGSTPEPSITLRSDQGDWLATDDSAQAVEVTAILELTSGSFADAHIDVEWVPGGSGGTSATVAGTAGELGLADTANVMQKVTFHVARPGAYVAGSAPGYVRMTLNLQDDAASPESAGLLHFFGVQKAGLLDAAQVSAYASTLLAAATAAAARAILELSPAAIAPYATVAQAEAGTLNTVLMTPARVKSFFDAQPALQNYQWYNLTSSRSVASNTPIQNTYDHTIFHWINLNNGGSVQRSTDNVSYVSSGDIDVDGSDTDNLVFFPHPPGTWFRVGFGQLRAWWEIRL